MTQQEKIDPLADPRLSLKAIGLWARCMSMPDDWSFNTSEMSKIGKEGKRAVYSAIDELVSEGYAMRLEYWEKSEDGKFTGGGAEYVFFRYFMSPDEKLDYIKKLEKKFPERFFKN